MIGFGTALIRKGMASKGRGTDPKFDAEPLRPISSDHAVLDMGICLTPGSAELQVFLYDELGAVEEILETFRKK
jgi:hypothetical protein